jgi:hypothetical protein
MNRVVINTNHKKYDGNLVGREGTVLSITANGWVKLQVGCQSQPAPAAPAGQAEGEQQLKHSWEPELNTAVS